MIEDRVLVEQAPVAWQVINGQRVPVPVGYMLAADGTVGFAVGRYDPIYPLTIDPILTFSTYLGGSSISEEAYDITVDSSQNIYVSGYTLSGDFPRPGAYDPTLSIGDVFVAKYDRDGTQIYGTYLGGGSDEVGYGIAVNTSDQFYVTGFTNSTNFPTTSGAADTSHNGAGDVFVTKFNSSGGSLVYSTYLGGASGEFADDIAVDSAGKAYVVGTTDSPAASFPDTSNAHDRSHNGANDVFVARLNTAGSALEYCSYMGGSGDEYGRAITVDSSTRVYITGSTTSGSSTFPETSNAYDKTYGGGGDAFVARFDINVSGSGSLQYNSYMGAGGDDSGWGIALDGANKVYVAGQTNSSGFPAKNAADASHNGGYDAFVAKLDPTVSGTGSLLYSTFIGGSGDDGAEGIAAETDGRVTIVGWTWSTNFPTFKPYPMQSSYAGTQDTFAAKLGPQSGTTPVEIIFNTILGAGDDRDVGNSIVVDASGRIYIAGVTFSNLFPTVDPAQSSLRGDGDAFVAKIFPEYIEPGHECR